MDRRLFLDLLSHYERWRSLANFVYISMGAYPLEDHKLIHRLIGITKLIAFDLDDAIVARQYFNRPIDSCHCIKRRSGDLVANFDSILNDAGFSNADGVIVWLDYTNPAKLGEQIREFEALLDRLRPGDIVRVTVNAHPQSLGNGTDANGKVILESDLRKLRFQKLKDRISEYLPSQASGDQISVDGYPVLLAKSFAAAALKAIPVKNSNVFQPLSIVRYADGQQMLSITGAVVLRGTEAELVKRMDLEAWPFASTEWDRVHQLLVPDLTVRERLFLERNVINKTVEELVQELGFESAAGIKVVKFLENYIKYYRFYPTLLSADL